LPDWFKAMPSQAFNEVNYLVGDTVKRCPPFIDAMTYGFIIPLPCDVTVCNGALSWAWDVPTPSVHVPPSLTAATGTLATHCCL